MAEAESLTLRVLLEKHHAALSDDLEALIASRAEHARQTASRETSETLNQTVRRITQAESEAAVLQTVARAALGFAQRAVVVVVESGQCRSIVEGEAEFTFDAEDASAVRAVVESRDPMVALATPGEIGVVFEVAEGERAYLFPVSVRQKVTAVLITCGGVAPAPLELFCEVAGLRNAALLPEPVVAPSFSPGSGLIHILPPAVPESASGGRTAWDDLSPEDQRLHLQAQRMARVRVAGMRLDHTDALRRGVFEGNVYGALRGEIDTARSEFLQTFLAKSTTMVDYLHLEITRSLAHDDEKLLGKEYPGPMV